MHNTAYLQYLQDNSYSAENILYTPAYPDIILTSGLSGTGASNDSPHTKIPPVISYKIRKSSPQCTDKIPFGPNKNWKYRDAGEFFSDYDSNGNRSVYKLKVRFWESLVEFTTVWRSGAEAETLCILFDLFMDMNERYFQKAGVEEIIPFGRTGEPDVRLDSAGVHYRRTLWYFRTQQFQYYGPITRISGVGLDVVPGTSTSQI